MKPVFVKVVLFDTVTEDPARGEGTHVFEGIDVDIAEIEEFHPEEAEHVLRLTPDPATRLFVARAPSYEVSRSHFFRVAFHRKNFSRVTKTLLSPEEVTPEALPVYAPSRLPYWDSGWDDGYETNEFFDDDVRADSSPGRPLTLLIPVRRIFTIGHRGAPYHFPENTIASFRHALDVGANALEFDVCLTKDKRLVVFHDPRPDGIRIRYEDFPFELASPEFDGDSALIKEPRGGEFKVVRRRKVRSRESFDILKLTLQQMRMVYRYGLVNGVEHAIPSLEEFLSFCSGETNRLELLFFDMKNPPLWDEGDRGQFTAWGKALGSTLRKFRTLPEYLVVANVSEAALDALRAGIRSVGETRCLFAYDASGSLGAMLGIKNNPLTMARTMNNEVVSVGARFRTGDLEEISEATRDRDYNGKSKIIQVVHWTINDPAHMYRSLAAGVNGIVTDRPDVLADLLRKNGLYVRPPKATRA
jgi:glycerophosphoryl diester phosphodiesterase